MENRKNNFGRDNKKNKFGKDNKKGSSFRENKKSDSFSENRKGNPAKEEGKGKVVREEGRRNNYVREDNKRNNDPREEVKENTPVREDVIEGRNAVIEAIKSDRTIEYIMISKGERIGSINEVIKLAKEKRMIIKEVDKNKLDYISETGAHQGVIAIVTPYKYCGVKDILDCAKERGEKPFVIILDEIEDPHNLGSIIRTAEVSGVHGIIIPKRRNVGITPTVYKSSAGAIEHMKVAKVTNINVAIDELKNNGVWVYGADMHGEDYCFDVDLSGAMALVIGSEGKGISKLTKSKCDMLVKIPMAGKINSLNASVAGGIIMYEILKQRIK